MWDPLHIRDFFLSRSSCSDVAIGTTACQNDNDPQVQSTALLPDMTADAGHKINIPQLALIWKQMHCETDPAMMWEWSDVMSHMHSSFMVVGKFG